MDGNLDIRLYRPNEKVAGLFNITDMKYGDTKRGQMITLGLRNYVGPFTGKVWSNNVPAFDGIRAGDLVELSGKVNEWAGSREIEVESVTVIRGPHEVREALNEVCSVPRASIEGRFDAVVAAIKHPGYRRFVDLIMTEATTREEFFTAPGAIGHHHAYIGGLSEHTVEVMELARLAARRMGHAEYIDIDLTTAGAIIHDLGKLLEYVWLGVPIGVSDLGRMVHHTILGTWLTKQVFDGHREELAKLGLGQREFNALVHIQVSHHGQKEYGSYYEPSSPEAVIVHKADELSAKTGSITQAITAAVEKSCAKGTGRVVDGFVVDSKAFWRGVQVSTGLATEEPEAADQPTLFEG